MNDKYYFQNYTGQEIESLLDWLNNHQDQLVFKSDVQVFYKHSLRADNRPVIDIINTTSGAYDFTNFNGYNFTSFFSSSIKVNIGTSRAIYDFTPGNTSFTIKYFGSAGQPLTVLIDATTSDQVTKL